MVTRWSMDNDVAATIAEEIVEALKKKIDMHHLRISTSYLTSVQDHVYSTLIANCFKPV